MTAPKLRSNFTPGSTPWAMRRAQWSALGLSDEDLEKPKIAIVVMRGSLAPDGAVLKRTVADDAPLSFWAAPGHDHPDNR